MKQLVAYITTSFPEKSFSIDLALALAESGVDSLELGIPFSDPVADGPVIEKANHLSLDNGFKFKDLIEVSSAISKDIDTLWMGYFNTFYKQDLKKLTKLASEIGVSGMIIPDMPFEETSYYIDDFKANNIAPISFVAPTDGDARIKEIISDAQKFVYLVAFAGITGSEQSEDLTKTIESIRKYTQTPVYVGFGVNEKTAKQKVQGVDGVIVGSAFVAELLKDTTYSQKIQSCSNIAKNIKDSINS